MGESGELTCVYDESFCVEGSQEFIPADKVVDEGRDDPCTCVDILDYPSNIGVCMTNGVASPMVSADQCAQGGPVCPAGSDGHFTVGDTSSKTQFTACAHRVATPSRCRRSDAAGRAPTAGPPRRSNVRVRPAGRGVRTSASRGVKTGPRLRECRRARRCNLPCSDDSGHDMPADPEAFQGCEFFSTKWGAFATSPNGRMRRRRADTSVETSRDAAAATWIHQRRRVAAAPRPRRGYSVGSRRRRGRDVDPSEETSRGAAAAATRIFRGVAATPRPRRGSIRGDESRPRRG